MQENGCKSIDEAHSSSELNIIENIWENLMSEVRVVSPRIRRKKIPFRCNRSKWYFCISTHEIGKLCNSMPNRNAEWLRAKRKYAEYEYRVEFASNVTFYKYLIASH